MSVSSGGVTGNNNSQKPSISGDGRYVVFVSTATNLVAGDTNGVMDVFLRDVIAKTTTRVSVATNGNEGNAESSTWSVPSISSDGRYVAFYSAASNLVAGDTNGFYDVFLRDAISNTTTRISMASNGDQSNGNSQFPTLSSDGRFVAYWSEASNLAPGVDQRYEIYAYDRQTGVTEHISIGAAGVLANNASSGVPSISTDGRFVTFSSSASNLIAGDTNGFDDIFVRDRLSRETTRVSIDSSGVQANSSSNSPRISADGRFVAYESMASNLVAGDTNTQGDVFLHDRLMGETTRVSVATDGTQGRGYSTYLGDVSGEGRYVSFISAAADLLPGRFTGNTDLYLHDRGAPPTNTPTPVTGSATAIAQTGATLNATVNDNGLSTKVKFEYGLTSAYGATVMAAQSPVTGATATPVSAVLSGLTCGTTYHFRVAAYNQAGLVNGQEGTVATSACGAISVTLSPAGIQGAQWNVDGGTWKDSGAAVATLTDGSHAVAFTTLIGYRSPANQSVTVKGGQTTSVIGTYSPVSGISVPLAAGSNHSLGVKNDGTVWAWGSGTWGRLGNGATADRLTPTQMTGLSGVTAVAAGSSHSLALKNDGTVWATGYNSYGQIGDGTKGSNRLSPVQAIGLTNVYAIAAGNNHSVALKRDGTVWAWGYGALGNGVTTESLTAVQIASLTGVTSIAAGNGYTIAVKGDGTVWSWGYNASGQLGDGTLTSRLAPVLVKGLTGVTAVAAASNGFNDFTVALKSDGTVWAWGKNNYGQLGNGTTKDSLVPVQVTGLAGVTGVAAGNDHAVAVKNDGTVWAWGINDDGELGTGAVTGAYTANPLSSKVLGLSSISAVAANGGHCLALKDDGTVWAWGYNISGQLGDGTRNIDRLNPVSSSAFVSVATPPPVCRLSASPIVVSAGSPVSLTSTCNPGASSYAWTNSGFSSTASGGTVSPTQPTIYTVIGTNSAGSSAAATAAVYVCNTPPSQNYPGLTLTGGAAAEQFASGIANDSIDGAAGVDTVIYQCNRSSFTITKTTSGWTVSSAAEGLDTLTNVERIKFGNETLALDISGNAGQAYRVYQAAFNRVPDNGGLKFWISAMDGGASLKDVAAAFMTSTEFQGLYGTAPTNENFVTKLYTNILHRTPDAGGYAYWVNALNTKLITQADALVFLSESTENQAGVINAIINGIDLLN